MLSTPPKSPSEPTDFWQSIGRLVALQNQAPPLRPVTREGPLPLSFPQERLWWMNQLRPEDSAHHISLAYRLTGELQVELLQQALQIVVEHHEGLRTTFSLHQDQPVQAIVHRAVVNLQVIDLQAMAREDRELEAKNLATATIQRPFDLSADLPLRAVLFRLGQEEFALLLVIHHIVFDGWSEGLLCRDLSNAYEALWEQRQPSLSGLQVQYADFAVWQRHWLQEELETSLLDYWIPHLDGSLAIPELPVKGNSLAQAGRESCNAQTLTLDSTLTQALRQLSQQQKATLFVTLLTAFKVLLFHYCEQDRLMVCTPVANRNRRELHDVIGYFVNLLLLQTELSADLDFETALQRVRQTVTQSFAYQDLPVQRLVSQFKGIQAPVSRVMFALQNTPKHYLTFPGVRVSSWSVQGEVADFDLFLSVVDEEDTLEITLKYAPDQFEAEFIQTLLERFREVLVQATAQPGQPLTSFLTFSPAERQTLKQRRQGHQPAPSVQPSTAWAAEVPRDPIETALVEIWEALLGVRPRRQDNFFELGGQSLVAVQLLSGIEARFSKKLPLNILIQAPTVELLAEVIRESKATSLWPVLVPLRTGTTTTKPPLFAIHGIGGGVMFYQDIVKYLDPEIPVYALQSLGMDGIQTPLETVEDMAQLYLKEIRQVQGQGPYHIAGYSFGGFVALEVAQRLQAEGESVALLAMLDAPTPDLAHRQPSLWELASTHLINLWNEKPSQKLTYITSRLAWLKTKSRVTNRDYEVKLQQENPEVRMYQVLQPNYRAAERYTAQPYGGPITVFRATCQTSRCARFPYLGWDAYTEAVEALTVPGDHYSLIQEPNAKVLGRLLNECLNKAFSGS